MKKYTDWQKYVKEQTDKLNKLRGEQGESPDPPKQVPQIDKDRFIIHKKETAGHAEPEPREETRRKPLPDLMHPAEHKPFSGATQIQGMAGNEPENPITSPFVSVQDVWNSAEKSARKRPVQSRADADPKVKVRVSRLPEISKTRPRTLEPDDSRQAMRDESREEIIERLMNPTINLEEAAKIMGVCKATVRRYTAMGILPHYRTPGNQRRFKLTDVIQFLENQRR